MPMEFINQNILLISIVVVSGLGLLWPMFMRSGANDVNPAAATLLINREDAHVIDVREADEFAGGHLPEAKNVPLSKLSDRIAEIDPSGLYVAGALLSVSVLRRACCTASL